MKTGPAIAEILKTRGRRVSLRLSGQPSDRGTARRSTSARSSCARSASACTWPTRCRALTTGRKIGVFCMQTARARRTPIGGVAQAYGESVPLLVIPAGYPRRIAHVPPNFNSTLDHGACHQVRRADHHRPTRSPTSCAAPSPMLRNGRGAAGARRVPGRRLCRGRARAARLQAASSPPSTAPIPAAVTEAAKVLVAAKRPVIYAGQGVHWAEA